MASGVQQVLQKLRFRLIDPLSRSLSDFWSWWIGELMAILPASLREAVGNASKRVVVTLDDNELVFTDASNTTQQTLARVPLDAMGMSDTLPQPISEIIFVLPRDKVLQRPMTLPLAAEENLREVLGFEMDRQTPFATHQVYYDFRVTQRHAATASIALDLVVSPKKIVDELLDTMTRWGIAPDTITTHDDNANLVPVNLLPRSMRKARRYSIPRLNTVLATISVLLLVVALALPPYLNNKKVEQLEQEIVVAEAAARGGLELRGQVERLTKTSEFLTRKKLSSVFTLQILEEVSRILPDNTWLTRFDFDGSEVQLQGQSTSAADLIQLLESSPLFRDARFRSPVVQVPRTEQERFHLSVQLETAEAT